MTGEAVITIGPVTMQVEIGDITRETTDIIVNCTNRGFNLQHGMGTLHGCCIYTLHILTVLQFILCYVSLIF